MPVFQSHDNTTLSYASTGDGRPVIFLHSLGFNGSLWHKMGIAEQVIASGRTAICLDARGHGASEAPRDPHRYANNAMARDVSALLDHLELDDADLVAYSMGSQVGLRTVQVDRRLTKAVLAGLGDGVLGGAGPWPEHMCAALEADPATLGDAARASVERLMRWGNDPHAIAAMLRSTYVSVDPDFSHVTAQVLLLIGDQDLSMGDPIPLANVIPGARLENVPADHITAMEQPGFAKAIVSFLEET